MIKLVKQMLVDGLIEELRASEVKRAWHECWMCNTCIIKNEKNGAEVCAKCERNIYLTKKEGV
jgi:uncharacterized paraquat-inducible protein A